MGLRPKVNIPPPPDPPPPPPPPPTPTARTARTVMSERRRRGQRTGGVSALSIRRPSRRPTTRSNTGTPLNRTGVSTGLGGY